MASTLQPDDSQNNPTDNSRSNSDQQRHNSVLPPFSNKLWVDKKLKLRKGDFKQSIDNIFKDKTITNIDQLTEPPTFPTPYVMAQFASKAYEDYEKKETDTDYEKRLALPEGWKLLTTASNTKLNNGYFGAAYWHRQHQQVVIAHRGTKLNNCGALWTDLMGVVFKHYVKQMNSATTFAHMIVEVLEEVHQTNGVHFQVFFTGHSLGGWLAQITTYTSKFLKIGEEKFLKSDKVQESYHPHTVVFESPGCEPMLSEMVDTFEVRDNSPSNVLQQLDITTYLSAPNRINTCNSHIGTMYRIFIDLSDMGRMARDTAYFNMAMHRMDKILQTFDPKTGQVNRDDEGVPKIKEVIDWPVTGKEFKKIFKFATYCNEYQPGVTEESLLQEGYFPIRYQTKTCDQNVNNLTIFSQQEQEFLNDYYWLRQLSEFFTPEELFSVMKNDEAEKEAEKKLRTFEIRNHKIRCVVSDSKPDATTLQALIPYVRRLLLCFPQIKEKTRLALSAHEIRNRVYHLETESNVEEISQCPLDFHPDTLGLRVFLQSSKQQVLHLRMVDGDTWMGLIKVYRVLEKTPGDINRLNKGQYTILTLERFLTVNNRMDFNKLLESTETPHLLMMSCGRNQMFDDETEKIFETLFKTLQQRPYHKIIFTTQSEDSSVAFLQKITAKTHCKGLVTRDGQFTWSDLTKKSQQNLLEKTVDFQGSKIALKKLISDRSKVANSLPFPALMEGNQLQIGKGSVSYSSSESYNKKYYIDRTFRHLFIKENILNDKSKQTFQDLLASTEQDFKTLCQQNPEVNVHLIVDDGSRKLIWQKSQGTLTSLRPYIDTSNSHIYKPTDLDKFLDQARHQRVMLISDTAGMGKSTVLTHLCTHIKQKFPANWVLKIDLNDHTDVLNVLKNEQIDEKKAIEIISEQMLKLKPGLELEFFKACSEEEQEIKIVLMLDGFDEISPFYTKTVIALMQALKQMSALQLWVTTRHHMREELEDSVKQLSYRLEPFTIENQIEFLKRFWCQKTWYLENNEGGQSKLEIYAKKLIEKVNESFSDKDKTFAGIPLQCLLLAEEFEDEVKIFYESAESIPDLTFELDLIELCKIFIDRRYDIYQEEKCKIWQNKMSAIDQREYVVKETKVCHQKLAFKVLFPEEKLTFINNTFSTFSPIELTRIGLVQVNYEGNLHFIHRSFAEYYVADFLVNEFVKDSEHSQQIQAFLVKHVVGKAGARMIRYFVDQLLSETELPTEILTRYKYLKLALSVYETIETP